MHNNRTPNTNQSIYMDTEINVAGIVIINERKENKNLRI